VRNAQATRERLIEAAAEEFAAYGFAGARVDRIAAAAQSNKAQIYHYFGSKDQLFEAVFDELVVRVTTEIPMTVDDLPGWAGRLFDGWRTIGYTERLMAWYRLERTDARPLIDSVVVNHQGQATEIGKAQADGRLACSIPPTDLLNVIIAIAGMWTWLPPELTSLSESQTEQERRALVVETVRRLVAGEVA